MNDIVYLRDMIADANYKRVRYTGLPPYLVEAIKELNTKIESLETEIKLLEEKKGFDF
jgi:hypothetical protein